MKILYKYQEIFSFHLINKCITSIFILSFRFFEEMYIKSLRINLRQNGNVNLANYFNDNNK